jgi:membrane protease YdiL (CAAX protease family)
VLVSHRQGTGDLQRDYGLVVRRGDALIGLPIGVLSQLIGVWLVYLPLFWIFGDFDVSGEAEKITDRSQGLGIVLLLLIVVIGAPIVEELFFRGLLLRSLEGRIANGLALVVSAVLFGAAHLQPIQFPALVFIGLVLGWLAQRFGRLGPSMFAHMGFNLVTVIILVAQR